MRFDPSRFNQTITGFTDSLGSFPIGGGDCGANVWVSEDGMLNLLLSKTDAFTEVSKLAKLGYLKFGFSRPVFGDGKLLSATLHLENGTVVITDSKNTIRITVAAFVNRPLYGVDIHSSDPIRVQVSLVNYRSEKRKISKDDSSARGYSSAPYDVYESADIVKRDNPLCLSWYHHNDWSYYENTLKNQHLTNLSREDPIRNRTFGCSVACKGFSIDGQNLCSDERCQHTVYITAGCGMTETPEVWSSEQAQSLLDSLGTYDFQDLMQTNSNWWNSYFNLYFLDLTGDDEAEAVTKGYTLQKYMLGCCSRGKMPVKFNGSIFTVEPSSSEPENYDFRNWGDAYWIQNTRLVYWDLLYSGSFDSLIPFFDLVTDLIPECRERCRVLFGHEGILLPETFSFYGTYQDCDFGYGQEGSAQPACINNFIRWHYNGALEISYMMLKFYEYTGEDFSGYFRQKLLPFIQGVLQFFKEHFPKIDGKMCLKPVSSLETWQDCMDDTPDIAGLMAVVKELKKNGFSSEIEETDIPGIPLKQTEGKTVIAPCRETFRPVQQNCENPELYPLFPFEIYRYDMSSQERKLLSDTFDTVPNRHVFGWSQMNIWAAMLGRTDFCRENIVSNFRAKNKEYFFDAYFGPNFDWTPDQDHGCSTSVATIFLLLQSYDKEVFLLPALPDGWKARFRLPSSCGIQEYGEQELLA